MKRGGPLKRKKALRSNKGLQRSGKGLARTKRTAWSAESKRAALAWKRAVMAKCARDKRTGRYVCPVCRKLHDAAVMEAHHVVGKQYIKRYVREHAKRLSVEETERLLHSLLWDKRNGIAIDKWCHDRHTRAARRIPRRVLPRGALQFAGEIGLLYVVERDYPA